MYKIIITTLARATYTKFSVCDICGDIEESEEEYPDLESLDGIRCNDDFVGYIDDKNLKKHLVHGYMSFRYTNNALWVVTEYESRKILTKKQYQQLIAYTEGQWSDGIGEVFE